MTLPNERTRAVIQARDFLCELLDPKATPRVPKEIRVRAYWILRHFPLECDMEIVATKMPSRFGKVDRK